MAIPLPKQIHTVRDLKVVHIEPMLGSIRVGERKAHTQIWIQQSPSGNKITIGDVGYVLDDFGKVIQASTFIVKMGAKPGEYSGYTLTPPDKITKTRNVWISKRGRGEFDNKKPVKGRAVDYTMQKDGTARIKLGIGVWQGVQRGWKVELPRSPGDVKATTYPISRLNMLTTVFEAPLVADQVKPLAKNLCTIRP